MSTSWNFPIVAALQAACVEKLTKAGVKAENIKFLQVPGAFELPMAALSGISSSDFSCVIALGCLIKGDTPHFDFLAQAVAFALQNVALDTGVPVIFGVLTVLNEAQAAERAGLTGGGNLGSDYGEAALAMAKLKIPKRAKL